MIRNASRMVAVSFVSLFLAQLGIAQTEINVRGSGRLVPIAIPNVCAPGRTDVGDELGDVIRRDLELSGYFEVMNPNRFIESPIKCTGQDGFAYSDWSVIGAEGLSRGVATVTPPNPETGAPGSFSVQFFLHDVQRQKILVGKEYSGDLTQVRKAGHKFANEIMRYFTGEPGIFGTQIAFSGRVGRFKELFVMDLDGSNRRQLTNDRGLAVSPTWNSTATSLVYTSYRNRVPDLFTMNLGTKAVRQITRGTALEIGARFMPGDDRIVVSRSQGDESDIVVMGLDGTVTQRLTRPNSAIEVSPVLSPSGEEMLFVSNRSGGPQIYRMTVAGGEAKRISFAQSNYCTSPAWSPRNDRIAFVCRSDAGFNLFVSNPDGSNPMQLTTGGDNEDPEFSPDGRYLVFATTQFRRNVFSLAIIRSDGSGLRQLTESRSGDFEPTWSSVLP
jgi:TolB protein